MDAGAMADLLQGWDDRPGALYERLAASIRDLIEVGDLPPGSRLPAERRLAEAANVSRGTVVSAYQLLREKDLVRARQGSGTVVAGTPPPLRGSRIPALNALLGAQVPSWEMPSDVIDLQAAAWHDAHDLPPEVFDPRGEDLERLLGTHGYFPSGVPVLRHAIARYLTTRGLRTEPDQVLVTCGAHQAIVLLCRMAVSPGEQVVVEELTYPGAQDALNGVGARVLTARTGPAGVDVDALDELVRSTRPRLVYLIPTAHNPTGATVPEDARARLAELAGEWEAVVVDDESLVETLHDGLTPSPLAVHADGAGPVSRIFTVGSASKTFWGGLRVGWIRGPKQAITLLTRLKTTTDLAAPVLSQVVTARLLDRADELLPQRRRMLHERMDAMTTALREELPEWTWRHPDGGLCLWAKLPGADVALFAQEAAREGVAIVPGSTCSPDGGYRDHVRIGIGVPPERLREAAKRLARAWDRMQGRPPASSLGVIV